MIRDFSLVFLLLISDRRNLHRDSRRDTEQNVPCHNTSMSESSPENTHMLKISPDGACWCRVLSAVIICGYLSEKVSFWLFKIFEIQKGRTFSFNDIVCLRTLVVNIAIGIRA